MKVVVVSTSQLFFFLSSLVHDLMHETVH